MALTNDQLIVLKAAVLAETDAGVVAALAAENFPALATFYNTETATLVWRTTTAVDNVFEAIGWKKLTPTDNPPAVTATQQELQFYTNICLACQGRQFNVQTMLVGREFINSADSSVRQGLNDALTDVPSGIDGATQAAGWNQVKTTMQRAATRTEEIFATGTGTLDLVYEGEVTFRDIQSAMAA